MCLHGFGGLTGETPAVRPAALRWSDRRAHGGQTGDGDREQKRLQGGRTGRSTPVRPMALARSDRQSSSVRPIYFEFEGNFYFHKKLGFWVYQPFTSPLVVLVLVVSILQFYVSNVAVIKTLILLLIWLLQLLIATFDEIKYWPNNGLCNMNLSINSSAAALIIIHGVGKMI